MVLNTLIEIGVKRMNEKSRVKQKQEDSDRVIRPLTTSTLNDSPIWSPLLDHNIRLHTICLLKLKNNFIPPPSLLMIFSSS